MDRWMDEVPYSMAKTRQSRSVGTVNEEREQAASPTSAATATADQSRGVERESLLENACTRSVYHMAAEGGRARDAVVEHFRCSAYTAPIRGHTRDVIRERGS